MKLKGKFGNVGLWVSLSCAIGIFMQAMDFKFNIPYLNEIINGINLILISLGIISNPSQGIGYKDENSNDINPTDNV